LERVFYVGEVEIEVLYKDIKNVHLRVFPPDGRVRVSVPRRMPASALRTVLEDKRAWIEAKRAKMLAQEPVAPWSFEDGEVHDVWGVPHRLQVVERVGRARVTMGERTLTLVVPPNTGSERRGEILERWYRRNIEQALNDLLPLWEARMDVSVTKVQVRRMKTRWGSCSTGKHTIRLNTELARRPPECLEYVLVHELAHLHEPSHNRRFYALMDRYLPTWHAAKAVLKQRSLRR
jgi:hypothetical protein